MLAYIHIFVLFTLFTTLCIRIASRWYGSITVLPYTIGYVIRLFLIGYPNITLVLDECLT